MHRSAGGGALTGPARGAVLGGVALAAAAMIGSPGRAFQDEKKADPVEAMVRGELKLALESIETMTRMREIGAPVNLTITESYLWSRRVLEARLYLSLGEGEKCQDAEVYLASARGAPSPDRVGFFEEHLKRMTYAEAQNRLLLDRAQISALSFANVEFNRRQAEVWLAREKNRRAR